MANGTVELLTDVPEKEKSEILKRAEVVLHCMRIDNVSLGVAEAMSVGAVPVAYKSTGSWMDILEEGKLGFAYSSIEEGAKYVLNLIENYDLYYKMKNLSFNEAREFTYAVFKSKVLPVMNALLDSK
jgi:glycosyltransferase involved in cell wall biosynthesis